MTSKHHATLVRIGDTVHELNHMTVTAIMLTLAVFAPVGIAIAAANAVDTHLAVRMLIGLATYLAVGAGIVALLHTTEPRRARKDDR